MKNKFSFLITPVVFCWCLFYLQACKEPAIGDKNLLNKGDGLNLAKDTLRLKILSQFQTPVSSSGVATGALGSISDPQFGNTFAGFYAQVELTSGNISFGTSTNATATLDSVVLTLQYDGQYGPFTKPVDVYVYEISPGQNLTDTLGFNTNTSFRVNTPAIGKKTGFTPYVICNCATDSVTILGVEYPQHLRIPLSNSYGTRILTADSAALSTNDNFLNLVSKGLYITTSSDKVGNGVEYFDLGSVLSKVTVYYHNGVSDSLYYDLPISGATLNHFDNIYAGTPVNASVTKPAANGEQKMYIQAGGGVEGKILINLDSFPKNVAINKAELVLTQDGSNTTGDTLTPPALLNLFRIDDAGEGQHLEDEALTSFGGILTAESVKGVTVNRYRFNFQHYFQKLVQGIYRNNGLFILSTAPGTSVERLVISNSSTDKNYQVTLAITYTKL